MAKSKLIVGIDGLEARVWGSDGGSSISRNHADESDAEDANGSQEDEDEEGGDSEEEPADSEDEDEDEEQDEDGDEEQDEDGDEEQDEDEEDQGYSQVPSSLPHYLSRAEEQKFLQNADRLLSRTLAAADADGNGITSEMCTCTITSDSL